MMYLINFLCEFLLFSSGVLYVTRGNIYPWKMEVTAVASVIFAAATTFVFWIGMNVYGLFLG